MQGDSYDVLNVTVKGQLLSSFIGAKPESRHTVLKKHIATAFSPGGVIVHEETIDAVIEVLIQQLKQNGPLVELASFLRYFAMDSLTRIAFSEDLGFMLKQQDIDNTLAGAKARFDHWHSWIPMPWLEKLLFKNLFVLNIARPTSQLAQLAGQKIGARMSKENVATRPDLLSKYLEAHEKDPEVITPVTVTSLTISTIHAGADTTATALAHIFNNLLRHPSVLAQLRTELSTASLSTPPSFNDLNKLPLLDAVIKESLRATPIGGDMMERVVPPSGADIAGTWIPGGTVVSVSHHVTDRDPETWGPDAAAWRPERWLEADELQRRKMERAYIGFSAGKRMCLGMHLAILEMKKCIPRLIGEFEVCGFRTMGWTDVLTMCLQMSLADPEQTFEVEPGMIASPKDFYVRLKPRDC